MDNLIGKQLGDYTILERIGKGGAASVYRAEQPSMKREIALKVIDVIEASESGDFFKRFEQEAALIASLEHIRILPVHSYAIQGNWAYMAMRYLRGGSLKEQLSKGRLPLERIMVLFDQMASGLAYAHSKGVIHRDLKPANIMLDENGNAFLTDFGLAKMMKGDNDSTQSGHIVGTITYMAPEQLRGDPVDHRADIYSMGTILYEMVAGRTPYLHPKGSDLVTMIYQRLEEEPQPPSTYDPDIPPLLEQTIMKAIARRPDQRFDSMSEMMESLAPLMATSSVSLSSLPTVDKSLLERARETDSIILANTRKNRLNNNPMLISAVVIAIAIVLFGGLLLANNMFNPLIESTATPVPPTPIPEHVVLSGVSGTTDDIIPDESRIEAAKARLGDDGFVAVIACNLSSEYHATFTREIRTFLLEYGLDSKVYNSDNEAYDQIPILEQAMAEGASGIILCPLDYSILDEPLQTVQDEKLPFVNVARADNLYGGVQLSSENDNYSMGYTVGQFAGEIINNELDGQAKVIILDFPDLDIIVERANGLEEGVLAVAPTVEIVGRYIGATEENGEKSIEDLLDNGIEFDVILSINDAGSYGAINALEAADIQPEDVIIVSIDAERKAVDYMNDNRYIRGTLSVGRQESALAATNAMIQLLSGGTIPESILVESGDMVTSNQTTDEEN